MTRLSLTLLLMLAPCFAWTTAPPVALEEPPSMVPGLDHDWQLAGGASWLEPGRGTQRAVQIVRAKDREQPTASVTVTGLQPGAWRLSGWFRPDLKPTPDSNFAAGLDVTWLDAAGHPLGSLRGPWLNGRSDGWNYREADLIAPPGTAGAKLSYGFRTTTVGRCDLADPALLQTSGNGPAAASKLAVSLRPAQTFFDPSEEVTLKVQVDSPGKLGGSGQVHLSITDSAGQPVATADTAPRWQPWTRNQTTIAVPAAKLPVGQWCRAEVAVETPGYATASDTCGVLVLPRPTDFQLKSNSPFAILCGGSYTKRWMGARWERPNWTWNVREMELSQRYGMTCMPMINAADQALHGDLSLADYAEFVYQSVSRFKGFIKYWQLGNEPPLFQPGLPEKYTAVLKAGYEAAKRADPDCVIAMAGITGLNVDPDMIAKALACGAGNYCDIIDIHLYVSLAQMDQLLTKIRGDMAKAGVDKPLIITEITANLGSALPDRETSGHVWKRFALALSQRVAQMYWFVMRWPNPAVNFDYCGLVDNTTDAPRPGAAAYWRLAQVLEDAAYVDRQFDPQGVSRFTFRQGDQTIHVVWTAGEPAPLTLRSGRGEATVWDVAGRSWRVPVSGGLCVTVTDEPLLITLPTGVHAPPDAPPLKPNQLQLARGGTLSVAAPLTGKLSFDAPAGLTVTQQNLTLRVTAEPNAPRGLSTVVVTTGGTMARLPVTVTEPLAVRLQPWFRPDGPALRVAVENLSPEACDGTLRVTSSATAGLVPDVREVKFSALQPGETGTLTLPVSATDPAVAAPCRVLVKTTGGVTAAVDHDLVFCAARAATKPVQIDGKLDDWPDEFPMVVGLTSGERADPKDGAATGPDDLSARAALRWDAKSLYLAVKVRDDEHHNTQRDGALWDGDGLQLGLTPDPDTSGAPLVEFGLALTEDGPQGWAWRNLSGQPTGPFEVPMAIVRGDGETTYELAIPWTRLPGIKPAVGTWLGFGLLVNEQDESNRGYYGWHAGIGGDKDPAMFGQVVLSE